MAKPPRAEASMLDPWIIEEIRRREEEQRREEERRSRLEIQIEPPIEPGVGSPTGGQDRNPSPEPGKPRRGVEIIQFRD